VSAETLRRAAALMREDHPLSTQHDSTTCKSPTCRRRVFHHAVADWLAEAAEQAARLDALAIAEADRSWVQQAALAVACAYLGESR
jgi:hypothetical protein